MYCESSQEWLILQIKLYVYFQMIYKRSVMDFVVLSRVFLKLGAVQCSVVLAVKVCGVFAALDVLENWHFGQYQCFWFKFSAIATVDGVVFAVAVCVKSLAQLQSGWFFRCDTAAVIAQFSGSPTGVCEPTYVW